MLKPRLGERWARLGTPGSGILVLVLLGAIGLAGWGLAFEPVRDPGGCISIGARGTRGIRSCDPNDIALHVLFSLAIGSLFGFLALRLLWQMAREFIKPLPEEALGSALQLLLNLRHARIQARDELTDCIQLELLRLGRDGQPEAAFRLRLEGLEHCVFYPENGRPRDLLPLLLPSTSLRFSPATRLAHPRHAHIDASIIGLRFESGQLSLRARQQQLQPQALSPPPASA